MAKKLLIAGGGTGGHIFPGIAIAEEWRRRGGDVIFVGTAAGQVGQLVPKYGFDLKYLKVGSLKGGGLIKKVKTLTGLPKAFFGAMKILKDEKPDVVLGIGGYASGPLCFTAALLGKSTAITDQNVHPGMTNRLLGKVVDRVFLSFEKSMDFFSAKKVTISGNPVRAQITYTPYQAPQNDLKIFIFGGSQGAVTVNQAFTKALELVPDLWPKLNIVHQAGKTDFEELKKFYEGNRITAIVSRFFDDMNAIYRAAHVVVCRSGAGTMTELALSGRPAILVPYPFAADDHQKKNAELFVERGAAWMAEQKDLNPQWIAQKLRSFLENPQELSEKAEKIHDLAMPEAAKTIVDHLLK
jgi:UDP-N-acetylglucosamine--N-acetylmuramyl-(pentapeptide) pyrophosphoryl-undecaprenol N-acetylglucosamine transferase